MKGQLFAAKPHPPLAARQRNKVALNLMPELAPLHGPQYHHCSPARCEGWDECQRRQMLGLWVLCEAPERDLVERARARGLV